MKLKQHLKIARLIMKLGWITDTKTWKIFQEIRNILDDDYHDVITHEEFMKYGNIYYDNGEPI